MNKNAPTFLPYALTSSMPLAAFDLSSISKEKC